MVLRKEFRDVLADLKHDMGRQEFEDCVRDEFRKLGYEVEMARAE